MKALKNKNNSSGHDLFQRLTESQSGQSMVEFLVILPVVLLLMFGSVQFALIFHAKITLNYAAFEAVRYGSLGQGKFDEVFEGFARGLAPLYSYFESDETIRKKRKKQIGAPVIAEDQIEAFQLARDRIYDEYKSDNKLVRIELLNPTDSSFLDFAPDEDIPNDNLMYRSSKVRGKSKTSIQEANLLHLRITYWYPLYVPFVNKLIFNNFICCKDNMMNIFSGLGKDEEGENAFCTWHADDICKDKKQEPVIPLTATAVIRMQSPMSKSTGWISRTGQVQ